MKGRSASKAVSQQHARDRDRDREQAQPTTSGVLNTSLAASTITSNASRSRSVAPTQNNMAASHERDDTVPGWTSSATSGSPSAQNTSANAASVSMQVARSASVPYGHSVNAARPSNSNRPTLVGNTQSSLQRTTADPHGHLQRDVVGIGSTLTATPRPHVTTPSPSPSAGSSTSTWTWTCGDAEERFTHPEHSTVLLSRIRELAFGERERERLCDVTIVVAGSGSSSSSSGGIESERRISAHRVVLSAASEYFEAMFSAAMRESRTHEVHIGNVDGDTMQQLVEYVYSGQLELREESVERVLAAACQFRLDAVVAACSAFLARRLHPSNCVGIWQFAERHACDALRTASARFCREHFCQLAALDEFLLLAADELERLLRADELNVPNEETVYNALVRWLEHDFENRLAHFARLLRAVRLPMLNESFLLNEIDTNPVLQSSNEILQLVVAALKQHVAKSRDAERYAAQVTAVMNARNQAQAVARVAEQQQQQQGAGNSSTQQSNMLTSRLNAGGTPSAPPVCVCSTTSTSAGCGEMNASTTTSGWLSTNPVRDLRQSRVSCMLDKQQFVPRRSMCGSLWIIGGVDATNKCSLQVESFNYYSNAYETVTQLPTRRLQFGATLLHAPLARWTTSGSAPTLSTTERVLLIVGGRDGLKTLNTADAFELDRGVWTPMPAMTTPRHGLGVAVLNNVLYAIGGHDGWSYLNTVERFELATRTWSYCAPLSAPRSTCGVVACGQRLYAVGGRDGSMCLRSVESFDPNSQKWTVCASMHRRRGGVACAEMNGYLYAVGGHDAPTNNPNAGRLDAVERYDPRTDQWSIVASLGGPRDAVAVGTVGGRLFAIGGFDGQHYLTTVQQYDDEADEWRDAPPLRTGCAGAAVVHVRHLNLAPLVFANASNGEGAGLSGSPPSGFGSASNSNRSSLTDVDLSTTATATAAQQGTISLSNGAITHANNQHQLSNATSHSGLASVNEVAKVQL